MKVYDVLDLTAPDVVVGKHSVWLPKEQIKVPFQWGGSVQKYQKINEQRYPLEQLGEDYALLKTLQMLGWAPPIGDWVYFKTVISTHPGGWWADPCGAYGYEMGDANDLASVGTYTYEEFKQSGLVTGTPGAWNDLNKAGNVIRGYLIDVRRSGWDRLRWTGAAAEVPRYQEDRAALEEDLKREGQFPFRERKQAYQEYFLGGEWHAAEREVRQRAQILQFTPWHDETVLDIGTQLGGFLTYAALRTAPPTRANLIGLDAQPEYIDLARRLARANGLNICFRLFNVDSGTSEIMLKLWLNTLWGLDRDPDHVLLLSMLKHLSEGEATVWGLHSLLQPKHFYLETNALKDRDAPRPFDVEARRRHSGGAGPFTGWSEDRNLRACYKVSRAA